MLATIKEERGFILKEELRYFKREITSSSKKDKIVKRMSHLYRFPDTLTLSIFIDKVNEEKYDNKTQTEVGFLKNLN